MINWVDQERSNGRRRAGNTGGCENSWPRTNLPVIILTFHEDIDYGDEDGDEGEGGDDDGTSNIPQQRRHSYGVKKQAISDETINDALTGWQGWLQGDAIALASQRFILTVVSGLRATHVTTSAVGGKEAAVVGVKVWSSEKSESLQQTSKMTGHEASSGPQLAILALSFSTFLLILGSMTPSPSVTM